MTRLTEYLAASVLTIAVAGLPDAAPSHAAPNPRTGSIGLQGLRAGVVVAIGVLSLHWQRFKSFLSNLTGRSRGHNIDDGDPEFEQNSDIHMKFWMTHRASKTNTVNTTARMRLHGRIR